MFAQYAIEACVNAVSDYLSMNNMIFLLQTGVIQ